MTKSVLEQAKQLFDDELNESTRKVMERWRTLHNKPETKGKSQGFNQIVTLLRAKPQHTRLKDLFDMIREMGGAGSGNWGHAGRLGKRGGSAPHSSGRSIRTGRDAQRRQEEARAQRGFFKGNVRDASIQEIFDGSSQKVKDLALETGIIATDPISLAYIEANKGDLAMMDYRSSSDHWGMGQAVSSEELDDYLTKSVDPARFYNTKGLVDGTPQDIAQAVTNQYYSGQFRFPPERALRYVGQNKSGDVRWGDTTHRFKQLDPKFSPDERAVLDKLAKHETISKGWHGARLYGALDKLSDTEMSHLQSAHIKAEQAHSQKQVFSNISSVADWKQSKTVDNILDEAQRVVSSTGQASNETYEAMARRILQSPSVQKLTTSRQSAGTAKDLIALAPTSRRELSQLRTKVTNDWDTTQHAGFRANVKKSFYVVSSDSVRTKYNAAATKYGNVQRDFYHGTSVTAARGINNTGFRASSYGMMGQGVYLANKSSKSAQYLAGGAGSFTRGAGTSGVLMTLDAALGSVGIYGPDGTSVQNTSYDTLYGKKGGYNNLRNDEWVVNDAGAAIPRYWMDVTLE